VHSRGTRHYIQSHNGHRGGVLAFYGAYGSNRPGVRDLEAVEPLEFYLVLEVTLARENSIHTIEYLIDILTWVSWWECFTRGE